MQDKAKKAKNKRLLVYKPYLKGNVFDGPAARKGLKLLAYYLAFAFVYLIVGGALQIGNVILRVILNLALILGACALLYSEGARVGDSEVAYGEIAYTRKEQGKNVEPKEKERCFHPLKGVAIALTAALVILLITVPHAVTAVRQSYTLQLLPSWVSGYSNQQEVIAPLQYYNQRSGIGALDILHMVGRVITFPFANIATTDRPDALLLVDRLSPLLACLPLLGFILGYLTGPKSRAMVHGDISSSNKRQQRRKNKALKARQARQAKSQKKNELI